MEIIKSRRNEAVKLAKSLHQKKNRDRTGLFILEGRRCLQEAVRLKARAEHFYYNPESFDGKNDPVLGYFLCNSAHIHQVSSQIMDYISPGNTSQQMLALMKIKKYELTTFPKNSYMVVLNEVSDPGNLGTIIRSAGAFSCSAVILTGNCVDQYNPKTVRSTAGRILDIPVINAGSVESVEIFCRKNNISMFYFSPSAGRTFCGKSAVTPAAVVFGGEARGFDGDIRNSGRNLFHLTTDPSSESLNLAVCASIVMEKFYSHVMVGD